LTRVRRTRYLAFTRVDEKTVDVAGLLRGSLELVPVSRTVALSVLTGTRQSLSRAELELALDVPEAWTAREDLLSDRNSADAGRLDELAKKGVVVTDDDSPDLAELRRRDEALAEDHWSPQAALYHYMAKWRDVRVDLGVELEQGESFDELIERAQDELERLGKPPLHFVDLPNPEAVLSLESPRRSGQLYGVLNRRKTSRGFDRGRRVTAEQLATVLAYVWGSHGLAEYGQGLAIVKKTSPSGGGLHPIEAYPLVRDVEGLTPGLYHYNVRDHTLELIAELEPADVEELALDFTAGQTYFQSAHVLFLMTARFPRSYWKYRDYPRAYGVILMDAGHLSQTLYLVCTDLGLGAFVTAAINGGNIEERLGLDGYREGAILVCGCGPPGPAPAGLEPEFVPYVPR
jgi:putative peptide maturation dehydrogenase